MRVFHIALDHVPTAGEVIYVHVVGEHGVIRSSLFNAVFVDVFDRRVLIPMCVGSRVVLDWSREAEFCAAFGCGKPTGERVAGTDGALCRGCDMAISVNGDFGKDDRGFAKVINKRYAFPFKRFEFLTFEVENLTFGERTAIHVAFLVLERFALGDLDGACYAVVAACRDKVGAVRPGEGDISFSAVDAVAAARGRDRAAVYLDRSNAVDADTVCASGRDTAAAYRDIASIAVDALAFA